MCSIIVCRFEYSLFDFQYSSKCIAEGLLHVEPTIAPQSSGIVVFPLPPLPNGPANSRRRWLSLIITARLSSPTSWASSGYVATTDLNPQSTTMFQMPTRCYSSVSVLHLFAFCFVLSCVFSQPFAFSWFRSAGTSLRNDSCGYPFHLVWL